MDFAMLIAAHVSNFRRRSSKERAAVDAWMMASGREPLLRLLIALVVIIVAIAALSLACYTKTGNVQ